MSYYYQMKLQTQLIQMLRRVKLDKDMYMIHAQFTIYKKPSPMVCTQKHIMDFNEHRIVKYSNEDIQSILHAIRN